MNSVDDSQDTAVAQYAHEGWLIAPEIQGLEDAFVSSLVKVTANLTESVRLIRAIQDSKAWKTGHYRVTEDGKKAVFGDFWDGYVPWMLKTYEPSIGMEHSVSWFRARLRWWKYVEEKGKTLEEAMAVPLKVQFALERIVNLETGKFKLPPSKQLTDKDAEEAATTLIDDVLDGKYTASQLTKMVEWQELALYSDGITVYASLDHVTNGVIFEPLFEVAKVTPVLMDVMTVKLRIREMTTEYEPGEEGYEDGEDED